MPLIQNTFSLCLKLGQNRPRASKSETIRSLVSKSDKIAHLTHNWKHRTSNQQNWSILHPAGRLHSHLDSLRSTTIQPCTRFASIPEASYHSAFSRGFSSFSCIFFIFAVQPCAALRGGSSIRCCGRQGRQRALARGGTGQQATS